MIAPLTCAMDRVEIRVGDCRDLLRTMPDESVNCVVTSPPYFGLRDYQAEGQIGLEASPDAFIHEVVGVFREVRRVLRPDGTCWVNMGDAYCSTGGPGWQGLHGERSDRRFTATRNTVGMRKASRGALGAYKPKDLMGMPWRVAFALQADGWYLRQDIIWHKPSPMPESVKDRCTKAHEYLFLLTKSARYAYDADAIKEPATGLPPRNTKPGSAYESDDVHHRTDANLHAIGAVEQRNKRSVWTVPSAPFHDAHFATYPPALIEPCILAGCPRDGVVLDPFGGAGTTGLVAARHLRRAILLELNPDYAVMAHRRISEEWREPLSIDQGAPLDGLFAQNGTK